MILEQLMPSLSPTMEEGTIVSWTVKPGDQVEEGQAIAEIQTDKAVVEWEALEAGYVAEILIEAGSLAKVNMVAALFTTKEGEDLGDAVAEAKAKNEGMASPAAGAEPEAPPIPSRPKNPAPPAPAPAPVPAAPAAPAKGIRVSPVAARMAARHSIDLSQVTGSGPDGRIVKRDIQQAIDGGYARIGAGVAAAKAKPKLKLFRNDATSNTVGLSQMRQVIGRRLLESKTGIPHFYVTERVDVGAMVDLRAQLTAFEGVKVTYNDLVLRACALTLRNHPAVNATYHGDRVVQHDQVDISVAVAIPDGLITPIVFNAHEKSVGQISKDVRGLAKKAKEGTLQPAEFEGGTFTISNLGMYGIEEFNAIINPPQAAIIAVGGIKDEPVVRDGAVVPGKTMRITLSCDHRVVDGADAAAFVKDLRELLERPAALLL